MLVRLTGVPASHPTLAVQLMLDAKGIPYRRRDLPNQLQKVVLPLVGYRGRTVPVLRVGRRRVQGSLQIARLLDELAPDPPLLPNAGVVELEGWLDVHLQSTARTLAQWAAKRDPSSLGPVARESYVPIPPAVMGAAMPLLGPVVLSTLRVDAAGARAALERLPGELDHVDAAIADSTIGNAQPNAADFQAAASVRLLTLIDELAPHLDARPSTALAYRLAPHYPGRFRAPLGL